MHRQSSEPTKKDQDGCWQVNSEGKKKKKKYRVDKLCSSVTLYIGDNGLSLPVW